jgi:hypothetical protein
MSWFSKQKNRKQRPNQNDSLERKKNKAYKLRKRQLSESD